MRIFVAGATGAVGRRLVPMLVAEGHSVTGMTRSPGKRAELENSGADAVVADALDARAVADAVGRARPEVIVHELTAIPAALNIAKFEQEFHATNQLRTEGTDNLLSAALTNGVRRFVAQSYAGWRYSSKGPAVKTESDPLELDGPEAMRETLKAISHLESAVQNAHGLEGIVLRYGNLYGPGTGLSESGSMTELVRQHKFPMVGGGTGIWSFLHVDDAAAATAIALTRGAPGVYNIVDDEPAPVSQWLSTLAEVLGAKPPMRLPSWLARLAVGAMGVVVMTEVAGASNVKAKAELNWQPIWPSWRQGFRYALGETSSRDHAVAAKEQPSSHRMAS